ncbi:hypothetical protein EVAR_35545_1 [Eumeta japonica]|uniref:Uncharacterized protein n=1 Tax=Eumeta variegata TaxID=151549 RepID=A0A4C1X4V0_EUMVA|nr:hypothetical protein EVAR_35545_1 [Eumeta japonica]
MCEILKIVLKSTTASPWKLGATDRTLHCARHCLATAFFARRSEAKVRPPAEASFGRLTNQVDDPQPGLSASKRPWRGHRKDSHNNTNGIIQISPDVSGAEKRRPDIPTPEIKVLGYIVSKEGIKLPAEKIKLIMNYPKPQTNEELRRFLGILISTVCIYLTLRPYKHRSTHTYIMSRKTKLKFNGPKNHRKRSKRVKQA